MCAVDRRRQPPGERHLRRPRISDRRTQLTEKQKARFTYGVLEHQFRKYFEKAQKSPGTTGEVLLQFLERRLDNVVFRLDIAESRAQARQLVSHGHITIGGRKVSIPSYQVKEGETIGWKESSQAREFSKALAASMPRKSVPTWLTIDTTELIGQINHLPQPDEIDNTIDTRMIVEYYSK
jgi:small subunit ribosomal protein S4